MDTEPPQKNRRWTLATWVTLAVALGFRVWIAEGGGQGYWPDESRYEAARNAVHLWLAGDAKGGWLHLIGGADHPLFKVVCLPAAVMDRYWGSDPARTAIYLGLFSTAALALLGGCARELGAGPRERWLAVFFGACTNVLFYYTRHHLPYDASLCFLLAALWLGLKSYHLARSFSAGLLAGVGFLTYSGYWLLGGAILVWHVLRSRTLREFVLRALFAGAGLVFPILILVAGARWAGGDYMTAAQQFSGAVNQGDFGRGHVFVWQFLWDAEGVLLLLWIAASVYALTDVFRRRMWSRSAAALAVALALYAALWIAADVTRTFVVYGRTARVVAPFFCFVTAWAVERLLNRGPRARWAGALLLIACGGLALSRFTRQAERVFLDSFMERARVIAASQPHRGVLRLFHVSRLYDLNVTSEPRPHRVHLSHPHPLQFHPYLYEGFNEAQRTLLRSHDLRMQLLEIHELTRPWDHSEAPPGPIRLKLRFPTHRANHSEPLVTWAKREGANFLYVRYEDASHVRFGLDTGRASVSDPIAIDFEADHDLLLGLAPAPAPGNTMGLYDLVLVLNGRIVMAERVHAWPMTQARSHLGMNLVGGSSTGETFSGTILAAAPLDPKALTDDLLPTQAAGLRPDDAWQGSPGPLHLRVMLPADLRGVDPLVTATKAGRTESVFILRSSADQAQIGYTRAGENSFLSAPFSAPADTPLDLGISIPGLMPPPEAGAFATHPEWRELARSVFVQVSGKAVLTARAPARNSGATSPQLFSDASPLAQTRTLFRGAVLSVAAAPTMEVLKALRVAPVEFGTERTALGGRQGPLRVRLRFPASPAAPAEPLFESGAPGAGDLIFVQYVDAQHLRIGLDHWGAGGPVTEPIDIGPANTEHEIVFSSPVLFPGADSPVYDQHPEWSVLRDWVIVALDGKPVLTARLAPHLASPHQFVIGQNTIGASTAAPKFSGTILETTSMPPDEVLPLVPSP